MSFEKATDKEWLKGRTKYVSGYCATINVPKQSQGHEGTRPVSASGSPMRTCTKWDTCPCTCHYEIDKMYEMIGEPRPLPEQSTDYMTHLREQLSEFWMPDLLSLPIDVPLSNIGEPGAPSDQEEAVPANVDTPTTPPARPLIPTLQGFTPTPTGRRARGELEYDVLTVCREFTEDVYEWEHCTPKLVAERIGVIRQAEAPSTGAINAVWDRWEKIGFAKQDKKPSRFVGFTGASTEDYLRNLKTRIKRDARRVKSEQRRGIRK